MSLAPIVRALGGELYDRGRRAVIPGPGHSRHDRSVSLLLSGERVLVHSFGRSTWREVLGELRAKNLIDVAGRPTSHSLLEGVCAPPPSAAARTQVAARLWSEADPLSRQISVTHVRRRGIVRQAPISAALRHHAATPRAVYAQRSERSPALLAAVCDPQGAICAVEITYLDPAGRRDASLILSRKLIGVSPRSSAVRLDESDDELLVGEGVFTTLSATALFDLPGWALLSAGNLRTFSPPEGVRRVLIAADRGREGEISALRLCDRLRRRGIRTRIAWPPPAAGDWNEALTRARSPSNKTGEREGAGPGVNPAFVDSIV